jgi:hypothetical protein
VIAWQSADRIASDRELVTESSHFSGAIVPKSGVPFPVGYSKDHHAQVVCPKHNVERKSTKDRSTEVAIEKVKPVRRVGDQINQPIQLIQKPGCCPNTSVGVPGCSVFGVLHRCRMEADRCWHQPFNLLRSWRRTSSQAIV